MSAPSSDSTGTLPPSDSEGGKGGSKREPGTEPLPHGETLKTRPSAQGLTRVSGSSPAHSGDLDLAVGMVLDQYQIVRKLGEGGMGAVYEAVHTKLDRKVAIKFLPKKFLQEPDAVARFEREAKAIGRLDHPNIVRATHAAEHQGMHYLVMEYVEGADLAKTVEQRGPLPVAAACKAVRQAALGLGHSHEHGIIHRDVKPSNLLLTKAGQVKVLDLGLARFCNDPAVNGQITSAGQIMGTPDYMAPEQWDDAIPVDHRADLYALGCTLFFLLTARAPYEDGQHTSLAGKMKGHVQDPIPDLKTARRDARMARLQASKSKSSATVVIEDDIPAEVEAIYAKLMAKKPGDRIQSARELAAALQAALKGERNELSAAPAAKRNDPEAPTLVFPAEGRTEPPVGRRKPRVRAMGARTKTILAGSVLIVVIGLIIAFGTVKDDAAPGDDETKNASTAPVPQSSADGSSTAVSVPDVKTPPAGWHGWPISAPAPAVAPFTAEKAAEHQKRWADYLQLPVEWQDSIGITFRLIPPGEFLMGSPEDETAAALRWVDAHSDIPTAAFYRAFIPTEAPQHRVILTKPFYLAKHELTRGQYEAMGGKLSPLLPEQQQLSLEDQARLPICGKSYSWLRGVVVGFSRKEVDDLNAAAAGYDFPTEAQWEFACRAGTTTQYWAGNDEAALHSVDWWTGNRKMRTSPVGQLPANPFGLVDLHGNVMEYCRDYWSADYYGQFAAAPAIDPLGPAKGDPLPKPANAQEGYDFGASRVVRGGGYLSDPEVQRSASRLASFENSANVQFGCRLSIGIDAARLILQRKAGAKHAGGWHGWPADAPAAAISPFNAAQAKASQAAWAAYLKLPVEWKDSIGVTFCLIPPGEFLMGSPEDETAVAMHRAEAFANVDPQFAANFQRFVPTEAPQHRVILTKPFYLAKHELTRGQFEALGGKLPPISNLEEQKLPPAEQARLPISQLSCPMLRGLFVEFSRKEVDDVEARAAAYDVPTEAQWEFACRAGTTTRYWAGDAEADLYSVDWGLRNMGKRKSAVGQHRGNPFGLCDLHGNVMEYCRDYWSAGYYAQFAAAPAIDPPGPAKSDPLPKPAAAPDGGLLGETRVIRGGGHGTPPEFQRSSSRYAQSDNIGSAQVGCRLSIGIDAARSILNRRGAP